MASPNQPKQIVTVSSATSTSSSTVLSSLPITVQSMQDNVELANMSIGQLLGHGQRRVSVTQVATVTPVTASIQIIHSLQGGGITMSQAQQNAANSSSESPSTSRAIVQLRVEGNRIVSSPDLRQISDSKVTFITTTSLPLSRASSATSVQTVRRSTSDSVRVPPMVKAPTPVLSEASDTSPTSTGTLLEGACLDDLMKQIDPSCILEDPVKEALLDFIDDFVEQVIERTCQVTRHRGSDIIEAKDVDFVLEKYFKIPPFPKGSGIADLLKNENDGPFADKRSRRADFTAHNQRLSVINKTIKKI